MRDFLIVSFLLTMLPVPVIAASQFLVTQRWTDAALAIAGWTTFPLVYWWPLGLWHFRGPRHWLPRVLVGYMLSLPLYVLCLFAVYASLGYRFDPARAGTWRIYLSVSPWFYVYTVALWLIVRGRGRLTRVARAGAVGLFVLATAAPIAGAISADPFRRTASAPAPARIVNARIVDTESGRILDGLEVQLKDGRIAALVDEIGVDGESGPHTLDARGAFLLPGLIDVHTHLQAPVAGIDAPLSFGYMVRELFGRYADHREQYLAHGVTSVRDLGGPAGASRGIRDALASGSLAGPRLFTVGRLVTAPGGHPVSTIWTPQISAASAILATDAESLARQLQADVDSLRPDAVKIVFGTIGRAKNRLGEDLLQHAVRFAATHRLPSVVHAEELYEVMAAVRSGATGIEHVASMAALPDALLVLMQERRPFVDATFGEYRLLLRQRGETPAAIDAAMARARATVGRLFRAGVPVVVGTDAPLVAYGAGLHDELRELRNAGLTAPDVLRSVTVNNAAYLGRSDDLGRIAPGFRADLILVAGNPLEDVTAVRTPLWTMVDGVVMWESKP